MDIFGLLYHILALLMLVIGLFVVQDNRKDEINITFYLYTIGAFGWMLSLYWGYVFVDQGYFAQTLILFRLAYAFSIFAMSFMTIFFYLFPRVTITVPRALKYLFF